MTHLIEQQFCVYLYGQLIGRIHRRSDMTRFVFEPDYWQLPDRPLLGLRFEENRYAPHQSNMRLPVWFSNLLPEGRLREWIANAGNTSVAREMELLAQVGHDLPGAVRVIATNKIVPVDLASVQTLNPTNSQINSDLWRFSLAGVGLKFSLLAKGDRLVLPAFGEGGDWIVKLPDFAYPDLPWNEWAMMTLAKQVGIDVPELRLIHRDQIESLPEQAWLGTQEWAYSIKRFDRGAQRELIHIEDLAQVRGFWPEQKYNGSYETVAALLYRNRDNEALREFVRRLTFNILIGNGDAHLKNWSLIYKNRCVPTLAPAYDLVATFVYHPASAGQENLALSFGRSKRFNDMQLALFSRLDDKLKAEAGLEDVARDLLTRIKQEWQHIAPMLAEQPELANKINNFIDARLTQMLGKPG